MSFADSFTFRFFTGQRGAAMVRHRVCRERVNCQYYEIKSGRAANDVTGGTERPWVSHYRIL